MALVFNYARRSDAAADVVALLASHEGRWLTGQVTNDTGRLG